MALTTEELKWANQILREIIEDEHLDYSDDYCFADVDDDNERKIYETTLNSSCCGKMDTVRRCPITGKYIKIGCSYGH